MLFPFPHMGHVMSDGPGGGSSTHDPKSESLPLVVIGASAGGVAALQSFFETIPADTGAAFAVVLHLDPEHRSELPHIISARTRMPVVQVQGRERLHANHVYVIPPDRQMEIVDH